MLLSVIKRLVAKFRRRQPSPVPSTIEMDLAWFAPVAASVFAESRRGASAALEEIAQFFGAFHRDVSVGLDAERGSLVLKFPCGSLWRFAVEDVESAAQIAAGARLGGLLLRLSPAGEGLVRIHGVWDRLSYVLHGLPASDAAVY